MRLDNLLTIVLIAVGVFIAVFLALSLSPADAEGSCLRCFEPVPKVRERDDKEHMPKADIPIPGGYPGPLPPLLPTPDPYPGHSWAREMCPVPDKSDMGYHWERVPGGCG